MTVRLLPKRITRRARAVPGAAPGSVIDVPGSAPPVLWVTTWTPEEFGPRRRTSPDEISALLSTWAVVWVEVQGLGDRQVLKNIATVAGIPDLVLEDIASQKQRAKIEEHGDATYVVLPGPVYQEGQFEAKQVDLFCRHNLLITFVESDVDWLSSLGNRAARKQSRLRRYDVRYLLYGLLDSIVDHYLPVLDIIADSLYDVEDRIFDSSSYRALATLNRERRALFELQRVLKPAGEMVEKIIKEEVWDIDATLVPYFRDLRDHIITALDAIEARRERVLALIDMTMSVSTHRMSETMKVLTIIATIFIPLSFIAGVFGMNFDPDTSPFNMPELKWRYGYPFALGLMLLTAIGLGLFFRKRRWFGKE